MKRLTIVLFVLVCLGSLIPSMLSAESDPIGVNGSVFWADFPSSGGDRYLDLYVQNIRDVPQTITVSPWIDYLYPDAEATGGWIDESWISAITPATLTLGAHQTGLYSVTFSIPPGTGELVYKTWLKISTGSFEKPITVWVRVGAAVPDYDWSLLTGGAYILKVTGYGAEATVDDPLDKKHPPIGVRSKCQTITKFFAQIEKPAISDPVTHETLYQDAITQARVNDPGSAIFYGKQEEVGNVYQAMDVEIASTWLTLGTPDLSCTLVDPLVLPPYGTGYIPWTLDIPDDVPNGCYWIWVHVKPAEPTGSFVGEDYISQFYIEVNRGQGRPAWFFVGIGILGSGIAIIVVLWIVRRAQEFWAARQDRKLIERKKAYADSRARKSVAT